VYVAAGGRAALLGVTEQLVGAEWNHAGAFRYCGSLGPLPSGGLQSCRADAENATGPTTAEAGSIGQARTLPRAASGVAVPSEAGMGSTTTWDWEGLGQRLAQAFGLVGLFGVDAIWAEGILWPLEVNPRWPASIEVLERAMGFSAAEVHVATCEQGQLPAASPAGPRHDGRLSGKAILFADRDLVISPELPRCISPRVLVERPSIADVPPAGAAIRSGWPIMTVFAEAGSREALVSALQQQARHWQAVVIGQGVIAGPG
jgi:predicted ATP-grasp superfamily ATP-dependent carboligase